jgi:hypothetical protein
MIRSIDNNNPEQFPHGTCPFQGGSPVPVPVAGGIATNQMRIQIAQIACNGDKCQLWELVDVHRPAVGGYCGMKRAAIELAGVSDHLCELSNVLKVLEPPRSGPSPIMRIAEALEALVKRGTK